MIRSRLCKATLSAAFCITIFAPVSLAQQAETEIQQVQPSSQQAQTSAKEVQASLPETEISSKQKPPLTETQKVLENAVLAPPPGTLLPANQDTGAGSQQAPGGSKVLRGRVEHIPDTLVPTIPMIIRIGPPRRSDDTIYGKSLHINQGFGGAILY